MEVDLITYLILILGGLVFLALAISKHLQAKKAAESWSTTEGVIVSSAVTTHRSYSKRGSSVNYQPQITYEYQVKGTKYTSNRLGFGTKTYSLLNNAEKVTALYQQGAPVTIHYHPMDPSKSVLETKTIGIGNLIVPGIILLGMGLAAIIFFKL